MYIRYNADLWDLSDVVEANCRRKNESSAAQARMARDGFAQKRDELRDWETFQDTVAENNIL
jgi:hypothetical protein